MLKTVTLVLAGVVLAFAVCRAAPVYEKVCKAPDVPRAVLIAGKPDKEHPGVRCPVEGLCFYAAKYAESGPANVSLMCLTPEQHGEALERYRAE